MAEELRRSQIITTYGIGAVSEMKDFTGVLKSPEIWDPILINRLESEEKIADIRLAKALNVDYFLMPPAKKERNSAWLPFTLFPRMLFCPKTKVLKSAEEWFPAGNINSWDLYCTKKIGGKTIKSKLIPSRFIVICPKGHMDDFPYYDWVHEYRECDYPDKPRLFKMRSSGGGATLGDIKITCQNCNKTKSMTGALSPEVHLIMIRKSLGVDSISEFTCKGNRPDLFLKYPHHENCGIEIKHLKFVLRNATNVHFPKLYSSLLIPPFSENLYEKIQKHDLFIEYLTAIRSHKDASEILEDLFKWCKRNLDLDENGFKKIFDELTGNEEEYDDEKYRYDEYKAFAEADNLKASKNFIVTREKIDNLKNYSVDLLLKVDRLREVRAYLGYTRIRPYDARDLSIEDTADIGIEKPNIELIRVGRKLNWLPAVEYFGEGIFISFDNKKLANIESTKKVYKRLLTLQKNLDEFKKESGINLGQINSRYIALHTLSHFLIKQISFISGYTLASIRERIYTDIAHSEFGMNAILLYVADTDAVGTLGGLCRLADEKKISDIFSSVFEESDWCSSDPVCRESSGQGMGSLNLAACHACTLLPETSCEKQNRFLDRTLMEYYFKV